MRKLRQNLIGTALAVFFVLAGVGLVNPATAQAAGPAPVNLLSAGNFVVLSKTGITNTGSHTSAITGNIGASPITAAAMNNVYCSEIVGTIYGVNAAYTGSGATGCFAGNPPLANKTLVDNAVADMGTAYADAAGRVGTTATELGAGNIGGLTIAPGLYKWSTDVTIPTDVTLSGNANDVWIFQISGNLSIAAGGSVPAGTKVVLAGGAQAANVYWQVGGGTGATLGTYSTFNGNILTAKQVIMQTGAVLNGRALAKTQVTLDASQVTLATLVLPHWNLVGTYPINFTCTAVCSGDYLHSLNIATENLNTGDFSGTGNYIADPNYAWNITGNTVDNSLTFTMVYTNNLAGYTVNGVGTIDENGVMSGTATTSGPNSTGETFTWQTVSGAAVETVGNGVLPAACTGKYARVIHGTNGNDVITGTSGNDIIFGYGGNDVLKGGGGNDCIVGGLGNDTIDGGSGNDVIFGQVGDDALSGGSGNDTIYGGTDNDTMLGDAGNDSMIGDAGTDSANGGTGFDTCSAETFVSCP